MPGFGSIDDLLKSNASSVPASANPAPSVNPGRTVEEKFEKKMQQIAENEKETEAERLAADFGVPYINLEKFPISHEALRQIPKDTAIELGVVCFFASQDEVRLGALDPTTQGVQDILYQIQERHHANGSVYLISQKSLERVLALYATLPQVKPVTKDVTIRAEDLDSVQATITDFASFGEQLQRQSTTDLVTYVLGAALKLHASDVHIEAEEQGFVVRFRLDGILHDAAVLPNEEYRKLISRIKLISSLKINITGDPQDGRFTIKTATGNIDVRVSTIPTVYGESVVMRLLVQGNNKLTLESLGLRGRAFADFQKEIARPNGMIITTGPTGSGKTTTLYAIMQILNEPGVKIITLEDPVEYKMEGVNQSQIDSSHGYTFAKGLRSMLRQDPDIAMVGEIRDLETAEIAIQSSLTGHLILSTIHTNDAAGAVPRFLSMGVKPFLLAPALNCVIGQRLVRRLCESCKQVTPLEVTLAARVKEILSDLPAPEKATLEGKQLTFYTAPGCQKCNNIGYEGRMGIYEIFVIDEQIEKIILSEQVSEFDMRRVAKEKGMVTMVQDGILKALEGITSVDEVLRVVE